MKTVGSQKGAFAYAVLVLCRYGRGERLELGYLRGVREGAFLAADRLHVGGSRSMKCFVSQ